MLEIFINAKDTVLIFLCETKGNIFIIDKLFQCAFYIFYFLVFTNLLV